MHPDRFATAFNAPEESPGFLLWQIANLWQQKQRAALKPLGLTHVQFVLLAVLGWSAQHEPGITQIDLANRAKVDPMMTSQVLRMLVERGLVQRFPHPRDGRANLVRATPAGFQLANHALPIVEAVDGQFFGDLGSEFAERFRILLEASSENQYPPASADLSKR